MTSPDSTVKIVGNDSFVLAPLHLLSKSLISNILYQFYHVDCNSPNSTRLRVNLSGPHNSLFYFLSAQYTDVCNFSRMQNMQRLQEVLPAFLLSAGPERVHSYTQASDGTTVFQCNMSTSRNSAKATSVSNCGH